MTNLRRVGIVAILLAVFASVRIGMSRHTAAAASAPPAAEPGATVPHMDHAPRHGGLVLMRGDTHFEVVLDRDGDSRVYFTDAIRSDLPASYASEVDLGLMQSNGARQTIPLRADQEGKLWVGRLKRPHDPDAIVRITYVAVGEQPYWIDVPLSAWPK